MQREKKTGKRNGSNCYRACKYWSESFQSNEGRAKMFKIAKQMRKERKDIVGSKYVRDENGTLKVKEEKVMERWRN